jgi:hypothetical protein
MKESVEDELVELVELVEIVKLAEPVKPAELVGLVGLVEPVETVKPVEPVELVEGTVEACQMADHFCRPYGIMATFAYDQFIPSQPPKHIFCALGHYFGRHEM